MQQAPTTGETPLHIAAHRGYKDIVEFLLSRDQVKNNINVEDNRGNTPLKVAQNQERKEIESILKRHGASEKPQELKQRSEKVSTPTPPAYTTTCQS